MRQISVEAEDRPIQVRKSAGKRKAKGQTRKRKSNSIRSGETSARRALSLSRQIVGKIMGLVFRTKSRPAKPKPSARRRSQSNWYRLAVLGGLVFAVSAPVGVAGYYIVQESLIQKAGLWLDVTKEQAVASLGLTIQEVSVTGRDRTTTQSLMKVLQIKRGNSILEFDPDAARLRVEQLGWVETASVMRRFPDEIFVRVTERRPFARWQLNGKTSVIDRNGTIVTAQDKSEFRYLPKIVGAGANEDAAELFDMLSKTPSLFNRLHNAVRIRDRRWNLEFDNGVTVMLPEVGSAAAWANLNQMQKDKKILNKSVLAIDLRSKDKMYVRLKPDDARRRREPGKET